jgi:phosphatidylethanolamine N-methyltransferase
LNNPEILSGAAFFGLALITSSRLMFVLAVTKHLAHWWFLSHVEQYVPSRRLAPNLR